MPKASTTKKQRPDMPRFPTEVMKPARKKSSTRQETAQIVHGPPTAFSALPFIERVPRPTRWRRRQKQNGEQSLHIIESRRVRESIYKPSFSTAEITNPDPSLQDQGSISLRFSFAAVEDDDMRHKTAQNRITTPSPPSRLRHPAELLDRSFSGLSFDSHTKAKPTEEWQYSTVAVALPAPPSIPELSKPKKQQEGYGFSYSDSLFYDSDDYPDTECEWDSATEEAPPSPSRITPTFSTPGSSFSDIVVVRDVGSYHLAKPQKRLACTTATREDTVRLQHAAKLLFKFDESPDIYAELVGRLERIVYAALRDSNAQTTVPIGTNCALKLCNFLQRTAAERIETGENQRVVEHEIEWAEWLVDASRTGVMHLKGAKCRCRPDWEE